MRVSAVNAAGTGTASAPASGTPLSRASAPTNVSVTLASETSVKVSWSLPASDGGSPITGFEISYTGNATTLTLPAGAAARELTIPGLRPGTAYTVTVAALTAVARGVASAGSTISVAFRAQPAAWSTTLAISPATVTTLAGNGTSTTLDGTGTAASFAGPAGLHVIGTTGYVRDGNRLRTIDLTTGDVTTIAGTTNYSGCYDHTNPTTAGLGQNSTSLVSDGSYLYWADSCGGYTAQIRSYDLTTHAISSVTPVLYAYGPRSLTIGPDGGLYYANGSLISRIDTVNRTLTTLITLGSVVDGVTAPQALGLASDASHLWISVSGGCPGSTGTTCTSLLAVTTTAPVTATVLPGSTHAIGTPGALSTRSSGIVSAGDYLYATDNTYKLLQITKATGTWTTIAGNDIAGFQDGTGSHAWFNAIYGIATDGSHLLGLFEVNRGTSGRLT